MSFIPRFVRVGRDSFFLIGPRGTGKTSWCGHEYPDALRVDLLNPALLRRYSATPEHLIELLEANAKAKHVVIDEIQELPALVEVVHLLLERKTGAQFILTGSSTRKLRRQGVNLLGGRATQKLMHPYMAAELGTWPLPGIERRRTVVRGRTFSCVGDRLRRFCRTHFSISRVRIPALSLSRRADRNRREFTGRMAEREGFEPSMGF